MSCPAAIAGEVVRQELKFVLPADRADAFARWLTTSPFGWRATHADRQVNNLYFDTFDGECLAEKLAGVSARAKLRLRWYGVGLPETPTLEVKCRRNGLGWKQVHAVARVPEPAPWRTWLRGLRASLEPAGRAWLDAHPVPMLVNTYRRSYFSSADGRIRATLDRDLTAYDQRRAAALQLVRATPQPDLAVLELKFEPHDRGRVAAESRDLPSVVSAFSKYEVAMRAVHG